jgi:hypothetical protein
MIEGGASIDRLTPRSIESGGGLWFGFGVGVLMLNTYPRMMTSIKMKAVQVHSRTRLGRFRKHDRAGPKQGLSGCLYLLLSLASCVQAIVWIRRRGDIGLCVCVTLTAAEDPPMGTT